MGFLTLWKDKKQQALKERVLKNREGVLDAFGEAAKGARSCPLLMGSKCISGMCEFFIEFVNINHETGQEMKYHQCAFVKTPLLMIELREEISKLVKIFYKVEAQEKKE